jgi:hypothetical protein
VMWLYAKRTKQRLHFVIPIGSRYSTVIHTADGVTRTHDSRSKDKAAMVLGALVQRAPWAVQGHTEELSKAWKSDQATFIRTVQSRAPKTGSGRFGSASVSPYNDIR